MEREEHPFGFLKDEVVRAWLHDENVNLPCSVTDINAGLVTSDIYMEKYAPPLAASHSTRTEIDFLLIPLYQYKNVMLCISHGQSPPMSVAALKNSNKPFCLRAALRTDRSEGLYMALMSHYPGRKILCSVSLLEDVVVQDVKVFCAKTRTLIAAVRDVGTRHCTFCAQRGQLCECPIPLRRRQFAGSLAFACHEQSSSEQALTSQRAQGWSSVCARYCRALYGDRSIVSTLTSRSGAVMGSLKYHMSGRQLLALERDSRGFSLKCRLVNEMVLTRGPSSILRHLDMREKSCSDETAAQICRSDGVGLRNRCFNTQTLSKIIFCGESARLHPLFEQDARNQVHQWDAYRRTFSRQLALHNETLMAKEPKFRQPFSYCRSLLETDPNAQNARMLSVDSSGVRSLRTEAYSLSRTQRGTVEHPTSKGHSVVGLKRECITEGQDLSSFNAKRPRVASDPATLVDSRVAAKPSAQKGVWACEFCGVVSSRRSNLARHIELVHSQESRKFACPQCPQQFSLKQHLSAHVRIIHERSSAFPCPTCGKTFVTSSNLRKHERTVHGNCSSGAVAADAVADVAI
mmetsp:Transcript_3538/g.9764  ORF Transcript_3538/g.9764 Transcript_3538/m.9764 type:complete len:575 (+) Transcript_3538:53-1777(+)